MKLQWKEINGKKRLQHIVEGKSMTDQSDKGMCDINNIMKIYVKTGLLPQFKEKVAQYIDTTQIPSYMEAQEQMSRAKELFYELPSPIRKLMDNNPANLEQVVNNPEYKDVLVKYGILKEKTKVQSVEQGDGQAKLSAQEEVKNEVKK